MRLNLSSWLTYLETLHPKSIDLTLARCQEVARRLACDHLDCPVITVAGTNGKGSTVATMAAIASAANLRVGVYTSPHLVRFNERIRIADKFAEDAELELAFEAVQEARQAITLTYFEFTTLAAFWMFQRAKLDLVVLEVGLGGRLDAVNIIDPSVSVITSIGLDHQQYLGSTLKAIAAEKAGIMRPGKSVILGAKAAVDILLPLATQVKAKAIVCGQDYQFFVDQHEWSWEPHLGEPIKGLSIPTFPLENAAAAVAAIKALEDSRIHEADIRSGIQEVFIPARCQVIAHEPLTILDVAHNPAAANWLAAELKQRFPGVRHWHAMFTCHRDKAVKEIIQAMDVLVHTWYVIDLQSPLAITAEELIGVFQEFNRPYTLESNPIASLKALRSSLEPQDGILIFGTFMLAKFFVNP